MNKLFELNSVDKTKLLSDLLQPIKSIASMLVLPTSRIDPFDPNAKIEKFLDPNAQLEYGFEKKISELKTSKKIQASQVMDIRKRARIFTLSV